MKLHDYLEGGQETNNTFAITDDSSANWALRKIKRYKGIKESNNALAQAEIDKIEQWLLTENEKAQSNIDYLQSLLAQYALTKREQDPDFKTLSLPNGKFGFRKRQDKWIYDDDKVVETLEKANLTDFIKVKKVPSRADIKKAFDVNDGKVVNPDTGEIIEGITIEKQEDNFNVVVD